MIGEGDECAPNGQVGVIHSVHSTGVATKHNGLALRWLGLHLCPGHDQPFVNDIQHLLTTGRVMLKTLMSIVAD